MRVVSTNEAIDEQVALDGFDGAADACVGRWQKPGGRNEQQTGVEVLRAVGLNEGAALAVVSALADFRMNASTDLAPAVDRTFDLVDFDCADASIEGDPRQDLRVGEVLRRSANLPDPLVGAIPHLLQVIEDRAQEVPVRRTRFQPTAFA